MTINLRQPAVALRQRDRYLPVVGGLAIFPSRAFAIALALTALLGCTSAARTVATAQNGYDYREVRYEEHCVITPAQRASGMGWTAGAPPVECVAAVVALHTAEKHLHEAAKALKAGGGLPLQLAAIKADAKKLAKLDVAK
jgi:hypothetical protein